MEFYPMRLVILGGCMVLLSLFSFVLGSVFFAR